MVWSLDWVRDMKWYPWYDWLIFFPILLSFAIQYTTNDPEMIFYVKCYRGGIFLITVVCLCMKAYLALLSL